MPVGVFLRLLRWSVGAVVAVYVGCLLAVYRSPVSLLASVCSVALQCLVEGLMVHVEVSLCLLLWCVDAVVAVDVGCLLAVRRSPVSLLASVCSVTLLRLVEGLMVHAEVFLRLLHCCGRCLSVVWLFGKVFAVWWWVLHAFAVLVVLL